MLTIKPLDYIDVNHFSQTEKLELIQGNAYTCYVALVDGTTRYVPGASDTIQIKFPRTLSVAAVPASQDVTVTATAADSRDTSIRTFTLTAVQTNSITSGGVQLIVTSGGTVKTYPVDNFVRRRLSTPGA